jgi:uncharacterized membrane protein YfcA
MPVFLPIAGISTNMFLLVAAGLLIGFLSGLTGVGGGFLMTPILIMIGVPPTIAAASDSNSIIATSSSAVCGHFRLGNVDVKLGTVLLLGGLCGSAIGVELIKVLIALGGANLLIRLTYIFVLGATGGYMFADGWRTLRGKAVAEKPAEGRLQKLVSRLPWQMEFPRSGVRLPVILPILLCVAMGILTAIMGVGGGFLIVPMLIYLLRVPLRLAVGTSLFQILFTCAGVTYMQAVTNVTVDLELALLLAAGSTIGAQIGVQANRVLRGDYLKILLASLALIVAVKMAVGLVVTPPSLLSHVHGHVL